MPAFVVRAPRRPKHAQGSSTKATSLCCQSVRGTPPQDDLRGTSHGCAPDGRQCQSPRAGTADGSIQGTDHAWGVHGRATPKGIPNSCDNTQWAACNCCMSTVQRLCMITMCTFC
jgi:hypothetical protein